MSDIYCVAMYPCYRDAEGRMLESSLDTLYLATTPRQAIVDGFRWTINRYETLAEMLGWRFLGCIKIYPVRIGPIDADGMTTQSKGMMYEWKRDYHPSLNLYGYSFSNQAEIDALVEKIVSYSRGSMVGA